MLFAEREMCARRTIVNQILFITVFTKINNRRCPTTVYANFIREGFTDTCLWSEIHRHIQPRSLSGKPSRPQYGIVSRITITVRTSMPMPRRRTSAAP